MTCLSSSSLIIIIIFHKNYLFKFCAIDKSYFSLHINIDTANFYSYICSCGHMFVEKVCSEGSKCAPTCTRVKYCVKNVSQLRTLSSKSKKQKFNYYGTKPDKRVQEKPQPHTAIAIQVFQEFPLLTKKSQIAIPSGNWFPF